MNYKLGAHLSISGGFESALESIKNIGGNCLQIFASSPRIWSWRKPGPKLIEGFIEKSKSVGITPVYYHASYLINLADNGKTGEKSVKSLISELGLAADMKVRGSVVHLGSFKEEKTHNKYKTLIENIKKVLENTPEETIFIIENAGTRKIGKTVEEIGMIIRDLGNTLRIKVCLDICHLHAAGYSLKKRSDFDKFLTFFDKTVGLDRLELIHVNDSKDELASLRDRHENIGEGKVGKDVFVNFLKNPLTCKLPFILETPGFDGKGPDKKNLDILKLLTE